MRICWAQYSLWGIIALLGTMALFSGCGAKGDLFMPEEALESSRPQAPATDDVPTLR